MAAESSYHELLTQATPEVSTMMSALREFIGTNQMMAYLVMMTTRLLELRRVLKPTGSLYLHCDPTASHYLKIVLDTIFGIHRFQNEIVWQLTSSHNDSKKWGAVHDILFFYSKTSQFLWNGAFTAHDPDYVQKFYRFHDARGQYRHDHIIRSASMGPRPNLAYAYKGYTPEYGWRVVKAKLEQLDAEDRLHWSSTGRPYLKRYLHEQKGTPIKSVITDIPPIGPHAQEKLGYPTQKPVALLERILEASSNEGDIVLDPFCGCGTTIHAAQKLKRIWIGIDITHLAIALQKYRLKDAFEIVEQRDYAVIGEPESLSSAKQLAQDDRYQFQWWALSLIQAQPLGGDIGSKKGRKGKDKGIDGMITFLDDARSTPKRLIVQVKSGKVKSGDIRDLVGTIEREKAPIGVFITLEPPSKDMKAEAASAGFYHSPNWNKDYPRLQILTIEELLSGAEVSMPPTARTYKKAQRERQQQGEQPQLL